MDQSKKRKAHKMLDINLTPCGKVEQKVIIVVTNSAKFFYTFFFVET